MKDKTLTEDEIKTLKKKALEILSVRRRDILVKYPFIGSIALRMEMVPVRDLRVRTACTDGNSVYFDIAFLSSLSKDEQMFVLAHEIWHAVLMHLVRRQNRIPSLFNIATDKEVNNLLSEDGFTAPKDVLMPNDNEKGKSAEEIYEMLLKKQKKQRQSMMGNKMFGSGNGSKQQSSSSSSSSSKSKSSRSQNQNSNSNGDDGDAGQGNPNDGNRTGELSGQFDKHIYDGEEGNDKQPNKNGKNGNGGQNDKNNGGQDSDSEGKSNGGCEVVDKYGTVGLDSDYQPHVSKDFADKMRETIISEAQRCEKTRGTLPAHVKALVKKISTPEIKWQELLAQFVTKAYNSGNRSWIPPNRRHVHNDLYLQSRSASKIRIATIIDTSGSTCGDRGRFLTELNSLIKSFGIFDLTILDVDAAVNDVRHYTQDDNLEAEIESGEFTMSGGGGTSLLCGFERILEDQIECDAIIVLTDGCIDNIPTNPTGLPTLWIITKDGTEDFCDWGQKVKLTLSDYDNC